MPIVEMKIPQMGEGLEQVFIIQFFKDQGEFVRKDEPIYEMETDKATLSVESAYEGTIKEWLAKPGTVLDIGTPIVRLEAVDFGTETTQTITHQQASETIKKPPASKKTADIPPRTRAHCLKLGLSEDEMLEIPIPPSGRLMPGDVDQYLTEKK